MRKYMFLSFLLLHCFLATAQNTVHPDEICGKWMSAENNLMVQVYKENNEYKGKILWFDDPDEDRDINQYYDIQNPNPALRDRKLIGMNVLDNLKYDRETGTWENGTIYDATSGRKYSSAMSLVSTNTLKVTGFWKFKFIGRSMLFKKVKGDIASR